MIKLFEHCPSCGGALVITECRCQNCNLSMRGEFRPDVFSSLSEDQLTFVRIFLRTRGNLSEVEKVLGVSYPTIRNKLDEINRALESAETPTPVPEPDAGAGGPEEARRAILAQVASGEITAAQALDKIREL